MFDEAVEECGYKYALNCLGKGVSRRVHSDYCQCIVDFIQAGREYVLDLGVREGGTVMLGNDL